MEFLKHKNHESCTLHEAVCAHLGRAGSGGSLRSARCPRGHLAEGLVHGTINKKKTVEKAVVKKKLTNDTCIGARSYYKVAAKLSLRPRL